MRLEHGGHPLDPVELPAPQARLGREARDPKAVQHVADIVQHADGHFGHPGLM